MVHQQEQESDGVLDQDRNGPFGIGSSREQRNRNLTNQVSKHDFPIIWTTAEIKAQIFYDEMPE